MEGGKKYFDIYVPDEEKANIKEETLVLPKKNSLSFFVWPKLSEKNKKNFWVFLLFLIVFCWGIFVFIKVVSLKEILIREVEEVILKLKQAQDIVVENPQRAQNLVEEAREDFSIAFKKYKEIKAITFPISLFYSPLKETEYIFEGANLLLSASSDAFVLYKKINFLTINQPNFESKIEQILNNKTQWEGEARKIYFKYLSAKFLWGLVNENNLPNSVKEKFQKFKKEFDAVSPLFDLGFESLSKLDKFLGKEKPQKYLILLENNYELRPGGGFIGTYGIWEFENGKTKNFFLNGVSNLEYKNPHSQPAPFPLSTITSSFKFMDSNIWPDFAASAQEALKFYEGWTGENIDGVIAITPTLIKDILKIIGPIDLPEYNLTVDEENFFSTIQFEVEAGKDKKNWQDPKQVIYLFANRFLDKIYYQTTPQQYFQIFQVFLENLNEKHILFYFKDKDLQSFIEKWNFGGRVKQTNDSDYLMLVNWNVGGLKSSLFVKQKVEHKITIRENGQIEAELLIKRHHTKDYSYPYYDNFTKKHLWLIGPNKNYMKIYLPVGCKVIETQNIASLDYYSEFNKDVLGFWFTTQPLEEKEVKIRYILPFKVQKTPGIYRLLIQKQPGDEGYDYLLTVNSEKGTIFSSFNDLIQKNGEAFLKTFIDSDTEIVFGLK